jgi:hypothetical protein
MSRNKSRDNSRFFWSVSSVHTSLFSSTSFRCCPGKIKLHFFFPHLSVQTLITTFIMGSPMPLSDLHRPSPLLLHLFLLVSTLLSRARAHQRSSSYSSSALTEWRPARASYYAADPEDAIGIFTTR